MTHEVRVHKLLLDPIAKQPIVILQSEVDKRILPIWIGGSEANAIALCLDGIQVPRPMTHDLLLSIVKSLNATVDKVVINDLKVSTFFAEVSLKIGEGSVTIDSRPSDAIALAIRASCPIFVEESVFDLASQDMDELGSDEKSLQDWLASLKPEDLGPEM